MSSKQKDFKKRKMKKYYCSSVAKKKKIEELEPGMKGFLITCNDRREPVVISEAYKLLNEYADVMYGPESMADGGSQSVDDKDEEEESIENALKKEVENIKSKFKERRFKSVKTKVKHVVFVKTTIEEPSRLVDTIFSDIEKTKLKKTRYCMKLIPIIKTCYASEKAIRSQAEELFRDFFEQGRSEATYCIVFKSRCNSTVKRDVIVPEVARIIEDLNEDWRVNYHSPDYVVSLDVITNVCAIGILKDFNRFRKYNLQSLAENEKQEAGNGDGKTMTGSQDLAKKCDSPEDENSPAESNVNVCKTDGDSERIEGDVTPKHEESEDVENLSARNNEDSKANDANSVGST